MDRSDRPTCDLSALWQTHRRKLALRGPEPDLERPFVAVLGGSETYGKLVQSPYPALLKEWIGLPVANLGVMQAGVSLFSKERWLLDVARRAEVTVVQVMGAQNMSNRLYCVHPRRNDRFLTSSVLLRTTCPGVDFAEINFTGHLIASLSDCAPDHFPEFVRELRWAWVQRMRRVLTTIGGRIILLWMSERSPDDPCDGADTAEPMFVTRAMLEELTPLVRDVVEVVHARPSGARTELPYACSPADAALHAVVAEALAPRVTAAIEGTKKGPGSSAGPFGAFRSDRCQSFSVSSGTAEKRSATSP